MLSQRNVQPRIHARATKDVVQKIQRNAPVILRAVSCPAHHHMRLMRAPPLREGAIAWLNQTFRRFQHTQCFWTIQFPHQLLHHPLHPFKLHIAKHKEHHLLGAIEPPHKPQRILRLESSHPLRRAQNVMPKAVPLIDEVFKTVKNQVRRRVVVTLYLIHNHLTLPVHLMLRKGAVKHDVENQFHRTFQMLLHEGSIHHRFLLVRVSIQVATHSLHPVNDVPRPAPLRTLEHHVFAEMRHPLLANLLVTSASIDADATIRHIRRRWNLNQPQPVLKPMCSHPFSHLAINKSAIPPIRTTES